MKLRIFGILLGIAALTAFSFARAQTPSYCNTSGPQGYSVNTENGSYSTGQSVNFCLANNTRNPLFFGNSQPWEVLDAQGNRIFQPAQTPVGDNPQDIQTFVGNWNQTNSSGSQVASGTYRIVFPGLPGTPSASFQITNAVTTPTLTPTATLTPIPSASPTSGYGQYGYWPSVQPSQWYVLPNQTITFNGNLFTPNETVTITDPNGGHISFIAGSGAFDRQGSFQIPFGFANSIQTFTISGSQSRASIPLHINVGSFYPNLHPSAYYVPQNTAMSATGTGFAPNEIVRLDMSGLPSVTNTADNNGNVSWNFTSPGSGGSFSIGATGVLSGATISRSITLAQ
jgi:hypothetical protein